jgi:spore coat protein U-like protein
VKKILWLMAVPTAMSMRKAVMKKRMIILAAIAIVLAMISGAYAAGSATPNVVLSATVATTCVVGGSGTMAFGSLDANTNSGGSTTPIMSGMTLWCTKNDSVAFAVGNGLNYAASTRNLKDSGSNVIPYTVAFTTPITGLGKSDTTTMVTNLALKATIAAGALDNVPAGSYGDTVVLTITY